MTEKRFKLANPNSSFLSMNCGIKYGGRLFNFKEVVALLNSLNDENEQLKKQLSGDFNQSNCITVQKSIVSDLKKENKKLKQNCKNYWYKQYKTLLNENVQLKSELSKLNILYKAKCKTEERLLEMGKEVERENEKLKEELEMFKPVMFQNMRKGTVILYRKGDVE